MIAELHHIAVTQSRLKVLEAAERLAWTHLQLREGLQQSGADDFASPNVRELFTKLLNQMNTFERLSTGN